MLEFVRQLCPSDTIHVSALAGSSMKDHEQKHPVVVHIDMWSKSPMKDQSPHLAGQAAGCDDEEEWPF